MFKYQYVGTETVILTEYHLEVKEGDVVTVEKPINNAAFVLIDDKKKITKEASE